MNDWEVTVMFYLLTVESLVEIMLWNNTADKVQYVKHIRTVKLQQ